MTTTTTTTTTTSAGLAPIREVAQGAWHRFLDVYEPLRPELYRYCRYLTRSPWDAEDLHQDALARAFVTLASMNEPPANPRAWLFRVASNLWIDRTRKIREQLGDDGATLIAVGEPAREAREAAGTLIARLSPQERAAVVLKDVFDMSLDEIAATLGTTTGAIKAALHRGRGKLIEPEVDEARVPVPAALDAFCAAFAARDLGRLTALLLDTATVDVVGVHTEYGAAAPDGGVCGGMMFGSRRMADAERQGGMEPRWAQGVLPEVPRIEIRVHRGEPLLVHWYAHVDGEHVRAITRAEAVADRLAHVRNYFYTPDFLADVCGELGVPWRSNGYRYW
jgi:RNA polymerase sigma-70 factor (ECF subfamily)